MRLLLGAIAATFCACSAMLPDRAAQEEKQRQMIYRMDSAHVFVTSGDFPPSKPYKVLGDLKYSEPFSSDAIDTAIIKVKLKKLALAKYPDTADAVIKAHSDVESSGPEMIVTVSGEVVQFDSSADRDAMHKMWENLTVSPR